MGLVCACAAAPALASTPLVRATVDPSAHSTKIARHFLGFSTGYRGLFNLTGHPMAGVNRVAVRMLANLATAGQGAPGLRLGGSSADAAWWNPTGALRPNGVDIDLGPYSRDAIVNFVRASHAPLVLGLNFAADRVAYARGWARAVLARLPRHLLEALEIGNEPEIYDTDRPFGTLPQTRPLGYSLGRYLRELRPFTRSLRRLRGHPPLAGPATCCSSWERRSRRIVRSQSGRIGLLTFHVYATDGCPGAHGPGRLSVASLLSDRTLRTAAARLATIRTQARRAHRRVRITTLSSASCGGRRGISDTYATSLWMTDWLFLVAAYGTEGVNVQLGGVDTPLAFGYARDHFVGRAGPEYYGMLLFARAIADHARLLLGATLGARPRDGAPVHVWATADHHGHVRVVVINKSLRRAGDALITVRGGVRPATLERLSAPSPDATSGISLGGLSIPDGTTDGRLAGTPEHVTVRPHAQTYRFTLAPASAALLTIPIPGRHG
jgi:hypothetical protein